MAKKPVAKKTSWATYVAPAALLALGVWAYYSMQSSDKPRSHQTVFMKHTFEEVKRGRASERDYVLGVEDLPEVIAVKNTGILKGVLYAPKDEELTVCLRDLLKGKFDEKATEAIWIPQNVRMYHEHAANHNPVSIPNMIGGMGGKPVQMYIVFSDKTLLGVNNDDDLRSRVIHELQHVEDSYYGFSLDGKPIPIKIDPSNLNDFTIFAADLKELRAHHKQLEDIIKNGILNGNTGVSEAFFGTMSLGYLHFSDRLKNYDPNSQEGKIRDAHFEKFKDITVENIGNGIKLSYEILGKKDSIEFGNKNK